MRNSILLAVILSSFLFSGCSKPDSSKPTSSAPDTLVLKNGGKILCQVLQESETKVTVLYEGGKIDFSRAEIESIFRNQQSVKTQDGIETVSDRSGGSLQNYPYLRARDGKSYFGKSIRKENGNFIVVKEGEASPAVIPLDQTEKIFLWPPVDPKTLSKSFQNLMKDHPQKISRTDPYTIYSDVESSDFVLYRNAVEEAYHRFMIHLFELVDSAQPPEWALGVILYGKYDDYLKSGGPPQTAGYFRPDDRVLRLYNVRELETVKWVLGVEEDMGKAVSQKLSAIESSNRDANSGKWQAYDFYEKLRNAIEANRMRNEQVARASTMETIRHEGAHQVLNLFGVDRDFRGVWFSEGMADYLSPEEPNGIVQSRIMSLKAELEKGHHLIPLDFMMSQPSGGHIYNFKDFNLTAQFYSQSWAFVHMLMNRYREPFVAYMLDLKKQDKKFNAEKDKALFQKHLQKSLAELDQELDKYVVELGAQVNEEEYLFFKHAKLRAIQQMKDFEQSVQNLRN